MVLERDIDRQIVDRLRRIGVQTIKLTTLGRYGCSGWPDRLCLLPEGRVCWLEIKRPGGRVTKLQENRHWYLRELDHPVAVVDSADKAMAFVASIIGGRS